MSILDPSDFGQFFRELHPNKEPFPWQVRLAERVCRKGWPTIIDLPTASGKTACIDIALFALATARKAARRIFFVVDRRVVVNEAALRAREIGRKFEIGGGILQKAADRFRELAGGATTAPLAVTELHGGIYRDESWVRNPLQPMVVVSTVDQIGSRLLFRGYGVSPNAWPIHAGLIANDSLIFLDEAHCSRAFGQTIAAIERYRSEDGAVDSNWAERPLGMPFSFVEMTATPAQKASSEPFHIEAEDRLPKHLGPRIYASKPVALVESAKAGMAETLKRQVLKLADEAGEIRGAAIIVNRVATARETWKLLQAAGKRVELVLGRMRPLDRDDQLERLVPVKSGAARGTGQEPILVVSTQCIEVGADLDFDVLVSECASIDALLQRFGRLDRLGDFKRALGAVAIAPGQAAPKKPDPVYGEALKRTWLWLQHMAGESGKVDFGIEAPEDKPATIAQLLKGLSRDEADGMRRFGPDAAVLLPAHLDVFAQTSPEPCPKPEPALYLHGREASTPDVQVVWRTDLNGEDPEVWAQIVALCPPVSAECMPVPISEVRRWLEAPDATGDSSASDIEGAEEVESQIRGNERPILVWRGGLSVVIRDLTDLGPGSTVVVPVEYGGWDVLGHKPESASGDWCERATLQVRRKLCLRLHPAVIQHWPETEARNRLLELLKEDDPQEDDPPVAAICGLLAEYRSELSGLAIAPPQWLVEVLRAVPSAPKRLGRLRPYPFNDDKGHSVKAWLLESRAPMGADGSFPEDSGEDETSEGLPVTLDRHTQDVRETAREMASRLLSADLAGVFDWAAEWHDAGKVDIRFQARLLGGDLMAAQFAPEPFAKGSAESRPMKARCDLPDGFRHELVSLQLAARAALQAGADPELALHLIASHHGRCRALAPVIVDKSEDDVSYKDCTVTHEDRIALAAHRLDSGVAERFWRMNRRYGWWGIAYLEALFRLSDWMASAKAANRE